MQIEEILIIKNGMQSYGISTDQINQISRVPSLMPLPLRPYGSRGLCAVSGNIISMLDINILLDIDEVDIDSSKARLITLNEPFSSNALLVSEVFNTVIIREENIEYIDKQDDAVLAIYKYNDSLVQVLSLEVLVSQLKKVKIKSNEVLNGKIKKLMLKEEDSLRFLVFSMENENFALNIDFLREIILADISCTDIVGSPKELLGIITLREKLVTILDLRTYYGFKENKSDKNRILIASIDGNTIGLLVDEIVDIKSVLKKDIENMSEEFKKNKISGVIHDDKSLISFLGKEVIEDIFDKYKSHIQIKDKELHVDEISVSDETDMIIFKLSSKEYAFDVDTVAEIIDVVDSTKVAYSAENIDGVINIRGQIVPIVSLFKKLNIKREVNEDSKIIVCDINDSKIGFIVDSISDIISVQSNELKTQDDELFKQILHLNGGNRLVLAMDVNEMILDGKE